MKNLATTLISLLIVSIFATQCKGQQDMEEIWKELNSTTWEINHNSGNYTYSFFEDTNKDKRIIKQIYENKDYPTITRIKYVQNLNLKCNF